MVVLQKGQEVHRWSQVRGQQFTGVLGQKVLAQVQKVRDCDLGGGGGRSRGRRQSSSAKRRLRWSCGRCLKQQPADACRVSRHQGCVVRVCQGQRGAQKEADLVGIGHVRDRESQGTQRRKAFIGKGSAHSWGSRELVEQCNQCRRIVQPGSGRHAGRAVSGEGARARTRLESKNGCGEMQASTRNKRTEKRKP